MTNLTHSIASEQILAFAREGRLIKGKWRTKEGGHELACLLGSIDTSITSIDNCPARLMPEWMATMTVVLFDFLPDDQLNPIGERYGKTMAGWSDLTQDKWDNIFRMFLIKTINRALERKQNIDVRNSNWIDELDIFFLESHLDLLKDNTKALWAKWYQANDKFSTWAVCMAGVQPLQYLTLFNDLLTLIEEEVAT